MPDPKTHAEHRAGADLDTPLQLAIAETMKALSTPSRIRLLYALARGEAGVGELAEAADLAPAAASQQLRVLRNMKLVISRREGQAVHYRLHDHHIEALLEEIRNHVEHAVRGWTTDPKPSKSRR